MTKWFDTNYHYLVPELGPGHRLRGWPATKPVARVREARPLGITHPAGAGRPGDVPAAGQAGPDAPPASSRSTCSTGCCRCTRSCWPSCSAAGADWVQLDEPALVAATAARPSSTPLRPRVRAARARRPTGRRSWSPPTSASSATRCRCSPAARSRRSALDFVAGAGEPRGARRDRRARQARRWSPAWSTAATSGAATCARRWRLLRRRCSALAGAAGRGTLLLAAARAARRRRTRPRSTRGLRAGSPSPTRRSHEVATLCAAASPTATGADRGGTATPTGAALADRRASATPAVRGARRRPRRRPTAARQAVRRARRGPARPRSTCRRCRPPRSARSRRPADIRAARAACEPGAIDRRRLRGASCGPRSTEVVALQEEIGLDVLVHGEPERNDMVQYFAEQLDGFAATAARLGAVLRHPLRHARRSSAATSPRPAPMTVRWTAYAQSLHRPSRSRAC